MIAAWSVRKSDVLFTDLRRKNQTLRLRTRKAQSVIRVADRQENILRTFKLRRWIIEQQAAYDDKRLQGLPAKTGLILATAGGLATSFLGPLAPMTFSGFAKLSSYDQLSLRISWAGCMASVALTIAFCMMALKSTHFRSVTLPSNFNRQILNYLSQGTPDAVVESLCGDILSHAAKYNFPLVERRFILLDCAVRFVLTSVAGLFVMVLSRIIVQ